MAGQGSFRSSIMRDLQAFISSRQASAGERPAPLSGRQGASSEGPRAQTGAYFSGDRTRQADTPTNYVSPRNMLPPSAQARQKEEEAQQAKRAETDRAAQLERNKQAELSGDFEIGKSSRRQLPNRDRLGRVEVKQLSWDEYDALAPAERSKVDFNGALFDASNADRAANLQGVGGDTRASYDSEVEKLFGSKDRGSDTYAPNTLALLSSLGIDDTGGDLDDWLNMSAVTGTQSKQEGVGVLKPESLKGNEAVRFQLNTKATDALTDVLSKGQTLLSASSQKARQFGAPGDLGAQASGFGSDQQALDYSKLFDWAVSPEAQQTENPRGELAQFLSEYEYNPDDFRDYMNARLRTYQQQQGDSSTPLPMTADETAQTLSIPDIRRLYFTNNKEE